MNVDEGRLNYAARLDNSSLRADAAEATQILHGVGTSATREGDAIDASMKKIGAAVAGAFAVSQLKDFAFQVAKVRGEFQQLEIAFSTMLQSKSKADDLMNQLIQTATTTPFNMSDIANSAKQLLAYGVEADKVNETLIRLGDIAAGLSIPINDLAFLYGTTMVQGRMYTQDLNQFLGRGIPLTAELAKQFGVSQSKVKSLVEEGKVGFPEVEKAIISLTSEGSKFGGLMEKQSQSIAGQMANIEDAIEQMFNELGKKSEDAISDTLSVISGVIEHWETIGKVIITCAAAFGTYKAAVLAVAAAHKIASVLGTVQAFISLTKYVHSAKDAMLLFNTVCKANPLGLVIGLLAAAAAAFGLFHNSASAASEITQKYGEKAATTLSRLDSLTMTLSGLTAGTKTYQSVMGDLNSILEEWGIAAVKEGDSLDVINEKRAQAIELIKEEALARQFANNISQGQTDYEKKVNEAQSSLKEDIEDTWVGDWAGLTDVHKELKEKSAEITTVIADYVQNNIDKIAGKTGEEYTKGLREMYDEIAQRMRTMGISEETIRQEFDWRTQGTKDNWKTGWQSYIQTVLDAKNRLNEYEESVRTVYESEKAAADSTMTFEEKVAAIGSRVRGADDDVHGLYRRIKELMSQYSENTIGFTIKFNAEVPAWMNSKDLPELKRLAEWFTSHGAALQDGQTLTVNGKTWTKQQLLQRGADYAQAAENKQTAADAAAREAEANAKENERKRKAAAREAERKRKEAEREAKQLADQQADRTRQIQDYTRAVEEAVEASELDIAQKRLELQEEGFDRELAQLNLNYRRLIQENKQREQELLESLADNKLREWLNLNPTATKTEQLAYRNSLFDVNSPNRLTRSDLTAGQQSMLAQYDAIAEQFEIKGKENLYKKLLAQYQDYETRRTETNKKFDAERRALEAAPIDETARQAAIEELERQRRESIKSINDEEVQSLQKTSSLFVELFADASTKSTSEINKVIKTTRELLSYLTNTEDADITPQFGFTAEQLRTLKSSPEQIKAITEQVEKLQEVANRSNPFKALSDALKDLFEKPKDGKNGESVEAKLKKVGAAANECADMVGGIAGKLSAMFEAAGNDGAAEAFSTIETVMSSVSNIASGFAQGGLIGGIAAAAGEAINLIGSIFSANARHAKALKEIQKEATAQQRAYNLALLEQRLAYEQANTVFGTIDYAKATNAVFVMKDAYAALRQEIVGTAEQQRKFSYKDFGNSFWNRLANYNYSQQKDLYSGLADIQIKTGHKKTGLFGWGKGKDIYSSILDVYPELIDKQGNFNRKLAESILDTRTFSGEGKEALQNMIDLYDEAEKAYQEVKDYLTGIFGDLGNTMSDALVDAFKNGTDAAEAFGDSVAEMLENIGKQMIFSTLFSGIIQKANDEMLATMTDVSLTEEQKFNRYISILDAMTSGILGQQDNYNALLEKYQEMAAAKGITIFEDEDGRQASEKGIATASQESVDELNGRATAIQGHTYSINESTKQLVAVSGLILESVLNIESNTSEIEERLGRVESYSRQTRDALEDISIKGLTLRK